MARFVETAFTAMVRQPDGSEREEPLLDIALTRKEASAVRQVLEDGRQELLNRLRRGRRPAEGAFR